MLSAVTVFMLPVGRRFVQSPQSPDKVYEVTRVIQDPEGRRDLDKIKAVLVTDRTKEIEVNGNDTVWLVE